jgi:hypothetical protein
MKKLSLILALALASVASFAQYAITGNVQENGQPVAYQVVEASAWNQMWTVYDTTDVNGDYSIAIPNNTTSGTYIDIRTYGSNCSTWFTDSVVFSNQNYVANFNLCQNTTTSWTVSGQVTTGNTGAEAAIVYLISQVYDSNAQSYILTAIDSVQADTQSGYYSMPLYNTYQGTLKLKAALIPGTLNYASYLPTYYDSSLQWNGNGVQAIPLGMNSTANIDLIAGTNTGGPAFIGGDVQQGANKSTNIGDPLAKRILILTDANNMPVQYTYSDVNGHFSITNLAYGTYRIFGDAPGLSNPYLQFTLDANHPSYTDMLFRENDTEFWGILDPLSVATAPELADVKVYPNPATDVINVKGLDAINGAKDITISNISGAVVFSGSFQHGQKVAIPVSELNSGFYMLNISTEKGSSVYKIVK